MNELETVKVKEKHEKSLLKIPGVVGVGSGGAIHIYVERLTPQLAGELPKTLDGIRTKAIETGKIVLLPQMRIPVASAIYANRIGRIRPVPGGCSMGSPFITAGTFACRAVDKTTEKAVGLTNNHIGGPVWGENRVAIIEETPEYQPGCYDGGGPDNVIGVLDRIVPVNLDTANLIDACTFSSDQLKKEVLDVGEPDRLAEPAVGMKVLKSGRSSGLTYSKIYDVNATLVVSGWGDAVFKDQIIVKPAFMVPGDSGSFVGEVDSFRTVGIGFAGSTEVSIVCKGVNVEKLLDVEIVPPIGYLPWWTLLALAAPLAYAATSLLAKPKKEGIVM